MEEHYCVQHKSPFYHNEKNGKSWYSHKTDDPAFPKGFHNEETPKAENKNNSSAEGFQKSLQSDSFYTCNAMNNTVSLIAAGKIEIDKLEDCYDKILAILKK